MNHTGADGSLHSGPGGLIYCGPCEVHENAMIAAEDAEAQADAEVDEAQRLEREGRGRCPYCGCGYMLRKDGKVRKHKGCGGGGHYPS